MKKKIIAMLAAMTLCIGALSACDGDASWSLADQWNAAESNSLSDNTKEENIKLTGKVVAEDIVYRVYENGILEILGEYSLEEEDMPEQVVEKILSYDFDTVYITGENIRYFPALSGKKFELYIDKSVKSISSEVFKDNSQITKLVVMGDEIAIDRMAFAGCLSLETVKLQGNIQYIADEVFSGCSKLKSVYISDTTGDIGAGCFSNCARLKTVKLPAKIDKINYDMFYGCEKLKEIEIPKTVVIICKNAFYGCISLENISLPDALTDIEEYAFKYCCSLKNVEIPKLVTNLGYEAFAGCASLSKVTIDKAMSEYAEDMYFGEDVEVEYYK